MHKQSSFTAIVNNDEEPTAKPAQPAKCGWTSWMNGHSPSPAGETETVTALRNMPEQFCPAEDITAIECRPVGNQNIEEEIKVGCEPVWPG